MGSGKKIQCPGELALWVCALLVWYPVTQDAAVK